MKEKLLFGLLIIGVILVSGCTVRVSTFTIIDAKMSRSIENLEPVGLTSTFAPDSPEINVWYSWAHAPSGTELKAVWFGPPNYIKITDFTVTIEDMSGRGHFKITKPTAGWPIGDYKVDIYADDNLVRSVSFKVE